MARSVSKSTYRAYWLPIPSASFDIAVPSHAIYVASCLKGRSVSLRDNLAMLAETKRVGPHVIVSESGLSKIGGWRPGASALQVYVRPDKEAAMRAARQRWDMADGCNRPKTEESTKSLPLNH